MTWISVNKHNFPEKPSCTLSAVGVEWYLSLQPDPATVMTPATISPRLSPAAMRLVTCLVMLTITACATSQALILRVNTGHDPGAQYAPGELTRMMTELGYQQLRVKDPVTQQSVTVAEKYGEYRLLFESLENNNVRVDIHADITDGHIALYFYDINHSALGSSELRLYEQLEHRVKSEYGDEHVHASRP